jgi:hypothetical protein
MAIDNTPSKSWDATWKSAALLFGGFDNNSMRAMSALVGRLAASPDVCGLFAITSMTTLRISPYSCYPDWFDGRHITVDASAEGFVVRLILNGRDPKQRHWHCTIDEALDVVSNLCREYL